MPALPTAHFSIREFACPCCGKWDAVDTHLVDGLEDMRHLLDDKPVLVTSGYRCSDHNKRIGGASQSKHVTGQAADIVVTGCDLLDVYAAALNIESFRRGGIGLYPPGPGNGSTGFLHVDTRTHQARWARIDGVYQSLDAAVGLLTMQRELREMEEEHGRADDERADEGGRAQEP